MKDIDPYPSTADPADNHEGPLATNPGVSVSFTVASVFLNPQFILLCDRPCSATEGSTYGAESPRMMHSPDNPRLAGVALGLIGPLAPGDKVTIKVRSADAQKITVLQVGGYVPPIQRQP